MKFQRGNADQLRSDIALHRFTLGYSDSDEQRGWWSLYASESRGTLYSWISELTSKYAVTPDSHETFKFRLTPLRRKARAHETTANGS